MRSESLWLVAAAGGILAAGLVGVPVAGEGLAVPLAETSQPAVPAESPTGWSLTASDAGGRTTAVSRSTFAAFALGAGESLDVAVPAQGLIAVYETRVVIDEKEAGRFRFGVDAEGGEATIRVLAGGREVARASGTGTARGTAIAGVQTGFVQLAPGTYSVSVRFVRRASEPARLRTVWERQWIKDWRPGLVQGFKPEPITPSLTRMPQGTATQGELAERALRGRVLLGELGCVNCHAPSEDAKHAVDGRPGPLLQEIARRVSADWLLKWVANPTAIKPGTHMPDVIGEGLNEPNDAVNIVHYLVSLGGGETAEFEPLGNEEAGFRQGRVLFHTLGCVSCHGPNESPKVVFENPSLSDEVDARPAKHAYGNLAGKWRPAALREFLLDPLRTHPAGRMPNMTLSEEEADLLTRYLIQTWDAKAGKRPPGPKVFKSDPGRAALGKAAFVAKGCASCHTVEDGGAALASTLAAPGLSALRDGKGCMDTADLKTPRYVLSAADRASISAGLASVKRAVGVAAPLDAASRRIEALGCLDCHSREGEGGIAGSSLDPYFRSIGEQSELGDEGRIPPDLTHAGWKLTTNWTRQVLGEAGRARPYMATRMPQYGASAEILSEGLAALEGIWPDKAGEEPKPSDELVLMGRTLVGEKGLNCISCHTFGDLPPAGTAGPNIAQFGQRLRYDWWRSYVLSPKRFKPGTRMSEFYMTGRSSVQDLASGDHEKQPDAMWAYFQLGQFAPPPDGVLPKGGGDGTRLVVGDRPVVFRSFLKDAGSRGIAVGFPIGVHFAYDATGGRLVEAWKGDFIDAAGAWKGRGGTITGGQGAVAWKAARGPTFVAGELPGTWPTEATGASVMAFKGYELDASGTPTFRGVLAVGDRKVRVSERFEPDPTKASLFVRTFRIEGAEGLTLHLNAGPGRVKVSEGVPVEAKNVGGSTVITIRANAGDITLRLEVNP